MRTDQEMFSVGFTVSLGDGLGRSLALHRGPGSSASCLSQYAWAWKPVVGSSVYTPHGRSMADPTKPVFKVSDRLTQVRISKKLHAERNVVVTEREAGGLLTDRGQIIDRPARRGAE
jgi:hypothetical protein